MRKLTSILLCLVLALAFSVSGAMTAFSVAAVPVDTSRSGTVTLIKYDVAKVTVDENGNIVSKSADDTDVFVENAEYSAYRILDFNGSLYTVNEKFKDAGFSVDEYSVPNEEGTISYGTTTLLENKITKIRTFITDNAVPADSKAVTDKNGKAVFENLGLGIYLIIETGAPDGYVISSQPFLITVPQFSSTGNNGKGEWIYDLTAYPKNENMQVDKVISSSNDAKSDSYAIGDTITFRITSRVPDYGMSTVADKSCYTEYLAAELSDGIEKFNSLNPVFDDVLQKGFTLDEASVKVSIGETELTVAKTESELNSLISAKLDGESDTVELETSNGKDCMISTVKNQDGSTNLSVALAWASVHKLQGETVTITYSTQLNNSAVVSEANNNTVTYNFVRDPATGEIASSNDSNDVYTYQMNLIKEFDEKSAQASGVNASAVTFNLQSEDGKNMNLIKNSDGNYSVWTGEPLDNSLVTDLNPAQSGELFVKGFKDGKYKLVETKTVPNYTLLKDPIEFLIEENKLADDSEVITGKVSAYLLSGENKSQALDTADDKDIGTFKLKVNNVKNPFNVPTTGGIGSWIFYLIGVLIMITAVGLIFIARKTPKNK